MAALPVWALSELNQAQIKLEFGSGLALDAQRNLPFQWSQRDAVADGRITFSLDFSAKNLNAPQALYIARNGNRFQIFLNGVQIAQRGEFGNKRENYAKQPHMFNIPKDTLQLQNTLKIVTEVQGGGRGGLSTILLGEQNEILTIYENSYRWRITGSLIVAVLSFLLGILALLLWLRQREHLFLWYGMGELLWALHMFDVQFVSTPLAWPWWGMLILSAFAIGPAFICKFALAVMEMPNRRIRNILNSYLILSLPLVVISLLTEQFWLWDLWKIILILMCAAISYFVVRKGHKSKLLEQRVLALAVVAIVVVALRDMLVLLLLPALLSADAYAALVAGSFWFIDISWARYAWCVFGVVLAWVIAERMRRSGFALIAMNANLLQRLAQRERELNLLFAQQSKSERQQAVIEERQRLTRDMHDGIGSQLLDALHLAQDPQASRDALTTSLRETLDHLKLTVDAMQDTEGDIASLLGALRYRLGPRLAAAGIHLTWSVASLPTMHAWTLPHSRDLQMILFEAFSNLIKHAAASEVGLSAYHHVEQGRIEILLQDNGRGFDLASAALGRGHGIINMRMRAARINARLELVSVAGQRSGGTKMMLTIQQ
jgi:signal transduction histidine kinase